MTPSPTLALTRSPDSQRFGESAGQFGAEVGSLGSGSATLRRTREGRTGVLKGVRHDSYGTPPVNNKAHLRLEMGLYTPRAQRFQTIRLSPGGSETPFREWLTGPKVQGRRKFGSNRGHCVTLDSQTARKRGAFMCLRSFCLGTTDDQGDVRGLKQTVELLVHFGLGPARKPPPERNAHPGVVRRQINRNGRRGDGPAN